MMTFTVTSKVGIGTGFGGRVDKKGVGAIGKGPRQLNSVLHKPCLRWLWSSQIEMEAFGWLYVSKTWKKELSWAYRYCSHQHIHRIISLQFF